MSRDFPALVDVWALVRSRRGFSGTWPLERMPRLLELLQSGEGEVRFDIQFGRDDSGVAVADLTVETELTLLCQRTLEPFRHPVRLSSRLGLIESEDEAAALPEGVEPFVVPDDAVRVTDLVEDELILAVPLVPRNADQAPTVQVFEDPAGGDQEADDEPDNPFAVLAAMKASPRKDSSN